MSARALACAPTLRARYQRSVHLERDAQEPDCVDGYQPTPLVRTLVRRLADSLGSGRGRAWSLTGPYGTGKSAFAVFLANLFGPKSTPGGVQARKLLQTADPALHRELFSPKQIGAGGLWPVLVTGERRSLEGLLLSGLHRSLEQFWSGRGKKPSILGHVASAARRAQSGKNVPPREVVKLFEEATAKVASSALTSSGLLVILDEAGKALEFAAHEPASADVQVLQELAEAANRSGDAPIVFIVTLHQGFDQYAGRLTNSQRNEWAKVQGRFEDVAFIEPAEQMLRLIGSAFDRQTAPPSLVALALKSIDTVASAMNTAEFSSGDRVSELLRAVVPLHPVTAVCLGPLFRSRLAQNERSLFAFLSASEPNGFLDFMRQTNKPALYPIDKLYDYVASAFAGRLMGSQARHWLQIDEALKRLPEAADELDARVIKAIGVFGALGETVGVGASEAILVAAFASEDGVSARAVRASLERLRKASLVVYRKYRDAYQLWEGSDLDIDALVEHAARHIDPSVSLVERMMRLASPRPLVAKRHLFETGTLRYFDVHFADDSLLERDLTESASGADGVVWIAIPTSSASGQALVRQLEAGRAVLTTSGTSRPFVVAVPRSVDRLKEVALDFAALEWVQNHTPDLQSDVVARREVATRLAHAERELRAELTKLTDTNACTWYFDGQLRPVGSGRELAGFLSDICDQVFAKAPVIRNELINRRHLSSAAAAARRALIQLMVTRATEPNLGIVGYPPEFSMYRSVLECHGIHRKVAGAWAITSPRRDHTLRPAWDRVQELLLRHDGQRVPVRDVYDALRRPPYGIKDGILPVLLTGVLLEPGAEIAVYEDGAFVPRLTAAVVERLLRSPDKFEVQQFKVAESGQRLFQRLMTMLAGDTIDLTEGSRAGLVPIARQLVRIVQELPDYSRNTQRIQPRTRDIREALLRAREPGTLIFRQLPEACGLNAFTGHRRPTDLSVESFVSVLREGLHELQGAYPALRGEIREAIAEAFGLAPAPERMRRELSARSKQLLPVSVDAKLKSFLIRVLDDTMEDDEWLTSLATLLGGKPPVAWRDRDVDEMRLNLGLTCQRFSVLESLLLERSERENPEGTRLIRISVAQPGELDRERIVAVREQDQSLVDNVYEELSRVVAASRASLPRDAVLAALALVAAENIAHLVSEDTTEEMDKFHA